MTKVNQRRAEAERLPSGKYRCRAYWTDESGKKLSKSFTAETPREAKLLADNFLNGQKDLFNPQNKTLGMLADEYIEINSAIFSPSTIVGYKKIRRTALQDIVDIKLNRLTQKMYQSAINNYSITHAYKTVANAHIFYNKILKENNIYWGNKINLPKRTKNKISIPETFEVQNFLSKIYGTDIYLYVLFPVCLGLRRSEILGLRWEDIDLRNNRMEISRAIVKDDNGNWVEKSTKTESGEREVFLPQVLCSALAERKKEKRVTENTGRVFEVSPDSLHSAYYKAREKYGFFYRFHALRHYHASILNAAGLPNKYAMERMGHATEDMLKQVYQHTLKEKNKEFDIIVDDIFDQIIENDKK